MSSTTYRARKNRGLEGHAMKKRNWRLWAGEMVCGWLLAADPAAAQQKTEISLSRQPGILYMPTHIIEKQKLIEKHAARLGLPDITTKWINFSGGGGPT